jgi:putative transposase
MTLWQRLLFVFAASTEDDQALELQYRCVENQILRNKLPEHITITPQERSRLIRFAKPLGDRIRTIATIVAPSTFQRWLREENQTTKPARTGRPRTAEDLRQLILRMARATGWGARRIYGELEKLGLASLCENTVRNILRTEGIEPAPERSQGTWSQFVTRHAATLWGCDFFTQKILTTRGFVDCFVFFFLHVGSRQVYLAGITTNPTQAWVAEQARHFSRHIAKQPFRTTHVIRDFDGKFGADFDAVLQAEGVKVMRVGPRRPKMNAHAERWVGSVRRECLDHFIVFGERHLRYLLDEYLAHYNGTLGGQRPHQGIGNQTLTPVQPAPPKNASPQTVVCRERLGGLLKHYYHAVA